MALRADVERVRDVLADGDAASNGTRGLAVFACGSIDLLEVVRLAHPIASRVVLDHRPCVEPLVRAGEEGRWCVLLVNRRSARIFSGTPDDLEETDQIVDDVHRQHDQGGWSQANYQRSVEKEKQDHLVRALDAVFERHKADPFDHVLVGAPEELVAEVEQRMHPYLRERLAGRLTIDVENSALDDVRAATRTAIDAFQARAEREALDRLAAGVGRDTRGASGMRAVRDALEQARVEILLVDEDFDAPELGEVLEKAITQSAKVMVVHHHDDLAVHGGVGAVLRF
jgi:peptide chain release factor subunit 1